MDLGQKKCKDGARCGHCANCVIGNKIALHNEQVLASQRKSIPEKLTAFREYVYLHRKAIGIFVLSETVFVLIGVAIAVIEMFNNCSEATCFDNSFSYDAIPIQLYLFELIRFWTVMLVLGLGLFVSAFLAEKYSKNDQ
jgi:hypothetical protein